MQSTSVRIDVGTHRELKRLAAELGPSVGDTVAQRILDAGPNVVHVVPLTSTLRAFASEVRIESDLANGLDRASSAQCQHLRALSTSRVEKVRGNVGSVVLNQIREVVGVILDLP